MTNQKIATTLNHKNLYLSIAISVFFFVFLEISARWATNAVQLYDVEMTKYSNELKDQSGDLKFAYNHKPLKTTKLMGVEVRTNSHGLREKEIEMPKPENLKRILFLGDSLTFGWGVDENKRFSNLFNESLKQLPEKFEVINAGHGNFNTQQQAEYLEKKGMLFEPAQVVLFYFINDAEQIQKKESFEFLSGSRFVTLFWSAIRALKSTGGDSDQGYRGYYKALYKNSGWETTKKEFSKIKTLTEERKIDFRVVILPELHDLKNYPFLEEHGLISEFLNSEKIPHLDLLGAFQSGGKEASSRYWVARDDAHPNAEANKIIFEASKEFIRSGLVGKGNNDENN